MASVDRARLGSLTELAPHCWAILVLVIKYSRAERLGDRRTCTHTGLVVYTVTSSRMLD